MLVNHDGEVVGSHQLEHHQHFPHPGWVEHDPLEIWNRSCKVITEALNHVNHEKGQLAAIGVTNQRESTVVWDPSTGKPLLNAIVWQDTRTSDMIGDLSEKHGIDNFREITGLPLATYFSGTKLRWILENIEGARIAAKAGRAMFGTIDSWLVWNLTGGSSGGAHVTDVTNASRTMLMNIETLSWDEGMLDLFGVPSSMLPEIKPSISAEPYGHTRVDGPLGERIPVCSILGDQHAALFGQTCFDAGTSKNTYGTGCFLLMNTGEKIVHSSSGLLTTVAYQRMDNPPVYALEGSVAVAGALVQWLRDKLGLIERSADIEILASQTADSAGVYFVPAFSGLFAPYWRTDARGIIAGLTGYAGAPHIARAVLESTAFQTWEIVEAMEKDSGYTIDNLKVDGGMVGNDILMQFQADILNMPIVRPQIAETTALGAAYAAGLASGFWETTSELESHWEKDREWRPKMEKNERQHRLKFWKKAVQRTFDWVD